MSTATQTLAAVTKAELDAVDAATKALAAAETARQKADIARQKAEQERARAYQTYLAKIAQEHPSARSTALSAAGESRAALEQAVRTDTGVFAAYIAWVTDSIHVWELDSELAQIRDYHGIPVRSTDPPVFNFGLDVAVIVDQIAFEAQDAAVSRIAQRRANFVNGRTA